MKNKVIITIASLGNVPTRELTPYVPITPDEIVSDIKDCVALGASIAHIHVRDTDGHPTSNRDTFKQVINLIDQKKIDVIKQVSTGARGGENTIEYRGQMLDLSVEMASLATGSSNFSASVNANSPELIDALSRKMVVHNIRPEIEIFDSAMISNAEYLVKRGLLKAPLHFNLVLNVPGSIKGTIKNLEFLHSQLPENSTFSITAIGKSHELLLKRAIELGGHVRTGIEDVIELDGRQVTNMDLVNNAVEIIKSLGKEVATTSEAKVILGL